MKKCCIIVLLMFLFTQYAYAAEFTSSYEIFSENDGTLNQMITISGTDAEAANKIVALKVWQKDKDETDFEGRLNDIQVFAFAKQTFADAQGNFTFTFPFNKPFAEQYRADIMVEGKAIQTYYFAIADTISANQFVSMINDPSQLSTMTPDTLKVFLADAEKYGIDKTIYNLIIIEEAANENKILNDLIDLLKAESGDGSKITFEDFKALFDGRVLLRTFEYSEDVGLLEDTIKVYKDFLGLENLQGAAKIYATYQAFTDKKTFFRQMMLSQSYTDKEDLIDSFKENVFMYAIKSQSHYSKLATPIEDNEDYLNLGEDYNIYKKSEVSKESVLKYIIKNKNRIASVDGFKNVFEDACDAYLDSLNNPPSSGFSGGNGGGGGSFGSSGSNSSISGKAEVDSSYTKPAELPIVESVRFDDLSGHWGKEAVYYLADCGIINGTGNNKFSPEAKVTREEFTKMVVNAFYTLPDSKEVKFVDVPKDRWSYPYIAFANKHGIVTGVDDTHFQPGANISRQDLAVILFRALQNSQEILTRDELTNEFSDYDDISDYAKNSVAMLSYLGIVNGSDGKFMPFSEATRAEAAQIIYNALVKGENDNE